MTVREALVQLADRVREGSELPYAWGLALEETQAGEAWFFDKNEYCNASEYTASDRVFTEVLKKTDHLVICGAGYVGASLARVARTVGFHVTVIDERPNYIAEAQAAGANECICDAFPNALSNIGGSPTTYFVIVTRGHRYDKECLLEILPKESAYIGMMGSRYRISMLREELAGEGVSPQQLSGLHAPIGLPIGAQSPEEIAVSILAELIQVRHENDCGTSFDEELLQEAASAQGAVLAMIVGKEGSAPRGIGTKMLVFADGRTVGTIGGGCVEAGIVRESVKLLREDTENRLIKAAITSDAAGEEGMICGGTIEVFLQRI